MKRIESQEEMIYGDNWIQHVDFLPLKGFRNERKADSNKSIERRENED